MKKIVAIIALDPRASVFYANQVQELFGDCITVNAYSVQEGTVMNMVRSDLYVMSTDAFDNRSDVSQYIPIDAKISEIQVGYRWETIRKLQEIPQGTRALFVNMTEKMVREATTTLNQLGVNHISFVPFYPGAKLTEEIELAVTPDEERYVPKQVKQVMNIGHRSCTSGTMIEIALKLEMEELLETEVFQEYFQKTATSNYSFDRMFARSRRLESQFDILMEILDEGIIGINEKAEIFAMNKKAEEITGLSQQLVHQKQATGILHYLPLLQCLKTKEKIEPRVVRINGVNVGVSAVPVLRQSECIGAFAILQKFNEVESRQQELRSQLMHKGYRAKYTFSDVVGESEEIQRTKHILRRMAVTESPVLLIGETGTGKELFAHAVHLESRRGSGPFVAINCGAMPENLLESELFGHEEGAFTGAKKGGRPGLFEFAHGGTLFLDEMEGMSPALQVKLLRVLQEHEIMRVGGNRIIHIDVRIVAATNESLEDKVADGSFRKDLYYRLNTLPVLIPPLQKRGADVFLLLDRFRQETGSDFVLSEEVKQQFCQYDWPGNIRELRNLAEYFSFTGSSVITKEDLPPTFSCQNVQIQSALPIGGFLRKQSMQDRTVKRMWETDMETAGVDCEEWMFLLNLLYQKGLQGMSMGRDGILNAARQEQIYVSQLKVRRMLEVLKNHGLIKGGRGRGGCRITFKGKEEWKEIKGFIG